jgi:peptidoglycan hydrolase-like protein with peptidoglycan-binding domain
MTDYKYPYGYAGNPQGMGTLLTWDQMMTKKTCYYLHPEVLRRFHALIEYGASLAVPLGVGTGWRVQPTNPDGSAKPGFASPGNSWHESCPVSPQSASAFAIDTVPNISWDWMESNCGKYGFRTFRYVDNEPWHIQPVEISTSRKYATVPPGLPTWKLPTEPDVPATPIPPPVEEGAYFQVIANRKNVQQGSTGKMARTCQYFCQTLSGAPADLDGNFGPQSVEALKNLQKVLKVPVDGKCGPTTWQAMENAILSQKW